MPRASPFVEHCLELLSSLGPVQARAMFGGWGLYAGAHFVGLIVFEQLYLKVGPDTQGHFDRAGGQPFVYQGKGRALQMSFWTPPAEALDSPAAMQPWALRALQAAQAALAARKPSARVGRTRPLRTRISR